MVRLSIYLPAQLQKIDAEPTVFRHCWLSLMNPHASSVGGITGKARVIGTGVKPT